MATCTVGRWVVTPLVLMVPAGMVSNAETNPYLVNLLKPRSRHKYEPMTVLHIYVKENYL